jgi:hypothetical protein
MGSAGPNKMKGVPYLVQADDVAFYIDTGQTKSTGETEIELTSEECARQGQQLLLAAGEPRRARDNLVQLGREAINDVLHLAKKKLNHESRYRTKNTYG